MNKYILTTILLGIFVISIGLVTADDINQTINGTTVTIEVNDLDFVIFGGGTTPPMPTIFTVSHEPAIDDFDLFVDSVADSINGATVEYKNGTDWVTATNFFVGGVPIVGGGVKTLDVRLTDITIPTPPSISGTITYTVMAGFGP